MSGKGSKRRQRRINTHDEEAEKKVEVIEQSDDNKSNVSIEVVEKSEKEVTVVVEIVEKENGEQEIKNKDLQLEKTKDLQETVENGQCDQESTSTESELEKPIQLKENGSTDPTEKLETDTSDIEPLVLDSDDPELQFPSETGSDQSSEVDKSPILNRCKTRRSQTRHIPTPKTPKALDFPAEEPKQLLNEVRVHITRLEPEVENSENVSIVSSESTENYETDVTNASVLVNLDDTTRNLDITSNLEEVNGSNFIENTKAMSYGETLRCLTGRKTLRANLHTYKPRFYNSTIELNKNYTATDGPKHFTPQYTGTKRKLDIETTCEEKRPRFDEEVNDVNTGFLSYLTSPFKSKAPKTEIPTSTPKLTAFKFSHTSIDINQSKQIDCSAKPNDEPKKWCSIM